MDEYQVSNGYIPGLRRVCTRFAIGPYQNSNDCVLGYQLVVRLSMDTYHVSDGCLLGDRWTRTRLAVGAYLDINRFAPG